MTTSGSGNLCCRSLLWVFLDCTELDRFKDVTTMHPQNAFLTRVFLNLAKKAKALNLDAIHDTVHEMARDEARHSKAFKGLLERYFGK